MPRPPKLTDDQRRRLGKLEPKLRRAARRGAYDEAKRLVRDIQAVLRPAENETRLQRAKNWCFEAAMEAGKLQIAKAGFEGVRGKTSSRTRVYLEATALLAVCHLRSGDRESGEPLMAEAHRRVSNIKSDKKQVQFHRRLNSRFESEWALYVLGQDSSGVEVQPDSEQIYKDAGNLIATKNEDELLTFLGQAVREDQVNQIMRVYEFSRKQLPPGQQRFLPSPKSKRERKEIGKTLLASVRRVLWKSLCDPKSDVYTMWFTNGIKGLADYRVISGAVGMSLWNAGIGYIAFAAAAAAVVIKLGVEVFCDTYTPETLMIASHE